MSARTLFVYFRVARASAAQAVSVLRELQAAWTAQWPGLGCEVMRRCDEPGETVTLMEVYRGADDQQRARIEREAAHALSQWLIGARHVEVFEPCA